MQILCLGWEPLGVGVLLMLSPNSSNPVNISRGWDKLGKVWNLSKLQADDEPYRSSGLPDPPLHPASTTCPFTAHQEWLCCTLAPSCLGSLPHSTQALLPWPLPQPAPVTHVEMGAPGPILGVLEAYKRDTNSKKNKSRRWCLPLMIMESFTCFLVSGSRGPDCCKIIWTKDTCPLLRWLNFARQMQESKVLKSSWYVTMHAYHFWTGALRIEVSYLQRFLRSAEMSFCPNHPGESCAHHQGHVATWLHYDLKTCGFDFTGTKNGISKMPEQSVLHACALSFMGVDPHLEQWKEIATSVRKKNLCFSTWSAKALPVVMVTRMPELRVTSSKWALMFVSANPMPRTWA